jgi:Tn3 transposase DDE domain
MLRKLGSYPRQNGLAVALRELGRIERTLFILDWLQQHDSRCQQVQSARPVTLLLEAAVADLTKPIEEHRSGEGVASLALVESGLNTAAQFHAFATGCRAIR